MIFLFPFFKKKRKICISDRWGWSLGLHRPVRTLFILSGLFVILLQNSWFVQIDFSSLNVQTSKEVQILWGCCCIIICYSFELDVKTEKKDFSVLCGFTYSGVFIWRLFSEVRTTKWIFYVFGLLNIICHQMRFHIDYVTLSSFKVSL